MLILLDRNDISVVRRRKMRKKLNTQFNTRQYMVSRDFEIYYYKDQHMKKVANHIHDYYEIYFFWRVMYLLR